MTPLVERERQTYENLWAVPDYAKSSPGAQLLPQFLDMSGAVPAGDPHWYESLPANPFRSKHLTRRIPQTVLDAGCGSGKGAVELARLGFDVTLCDLTDGGLMDEAKALPFFSQCLWDPIAARPDRTFDWVYCCDVLEHIPPTFTMLVVSRLLEASRKGLFLSIALVEDHFGVWAGRPLHLSMQNFVAWREQLGALGRVKESRDLLNTGLYLVEPRC